MKKKHKNGKNKWSFGKIILLCVFIVLGIYCTISLMLFLPHLIKFTKGEYVVELNDLPTFKEIFSGIFLSISIIATSSFSYLIYSTTKKQSEISIMMHNTSKEQNKISQLLYETTEKQRKNLYEDKMISIVNIIYYELKSMYKSLYFDFIESNLDKIKLEDTDPRETLLLRVIENKKTKYKISKGLRLKVAEISVFLVRENSFTENDIDNLFVELSRMEEYDGSDIDLMRGSLDIRFADKIKNSEMKAAELYIIYIEYEKENFINILSTSNVNILHKLKKRDTVGDIF